MTQALWTPSEDQIKKTQLFQFMTDVNAQAGQNLANYEDLHAWSVQNPETFWSMLWDRCGVIGEKGRRIQKKDGAFFERRFFPDATLNFAENLLRRRDQAPAIIFRNQKEQDRIVSFQALYDQVSLWQQAFQNAGIQKGDRIAAFMPNIPETIIAMLAASSLGAIWSSASPDFGVQGVLDRFGQIDPKLFIAVDGYFYGDKELDCMEKLSEIVPALPSVKQTIIVPFLNQAPFVDSLGNAILSHDFVSAYQPQEIAFAPLAFDHPLYIMFSSGTTGKPKCIVHGQGGTLLQHLKEHRLQSNVNRDDRVFYFTTCGWMMWNWLVSGLAAEATLLLFDGNPFAPDGEILWRFAEDHKCTFFGTSAKYIDALKTNDLSPKDRHDLSHLRVIASTGSPLVHESFDYVYAHIKEDVHLASISGGTDIVSCFVLGNPISPVYRGEIQGAGLGMAINAFDDDGQPLPPEGGSGELVCTLPFPCMPVGFWNDPGHKRFKSAYFERYEDIWHHGDWIEKTPQGGFIIHGRSDATLNPGGVRIGTAEIYRQVEQISSIAESMAVGQNWEGDVRVVLFVVLKGDAVLDDALKAEIKKRIREGASPRHVPGCIVAVPDLPRTKSGKITELAVRNIIHGREVKNTEALANPDALSYFKDLPELAA